MFAQYQSPLFCWGAFFSPKFCIGGDWKKMSAWGTQRVPAMDICLGEAYYVSCVKKTFKIKYDFESSISNVEIGLFYPNNQLMFSFVTFWFC